MNTTTSTSTSTTTSRVARGGRLAIGVLAGITALGITAGSAAAEGTCPADGKVEVAGEPTSIVVTAPEGKLISGYCVKAGSANQDDGGPELVDVNPPAEQVTISHSSGKAISHYRVTYTDVSPPTTQPETPTPEPETPANEPETPAQPEPEIQVASQGPAASPEQVSSHAPAQLPATGSTSTLLVITAAGLCGLGALSFGASRRRSTN